MAKYLVQVFYMKYVEVNAESERDAQIEAKMKVREELDDEPIKVKDLTFTTTDKID